MKTPWTRWIVVGALSLAALETSKSGSLRLMIAKGLGVKDVPAEHEAILAFLAEKQNFAGSIPIPAFSYDLAFAEVFYPNGEVSNRGGFNAVLGNPPWDSIIFKSKEFFASLDFKILNAPTKRERDLIENKILKNPSYRSLFQDYQENFEEQKRSNDILYDFQKIKIEGDLAGRQLDSFRVFMERNFHVLSKNGLTGIVVPSAFHANEGATGVRKLYFESMSIKCCYSFENTRKIFEIHSSFKFALLVAKKGEETKDFPCAFYLHDEDFLFSPDRDIDSLRYDFDFVKKTGGSYLTLLEIKNSKSAEIAKTMFSSALALGKYCAKQNIRFQTQPASLHMTKEADRFRNTSDFLHASSDPRSPQNLNNLINAGIYYLSEGKTFHQYDDQWGDTPRYCVPIENLNKNPLWEMAGRFYRLAFRAIATSTNERTSIFCLLTPGTVSGNSVAVDRSPSDTPFAKALIVIGVCNSFSFDWVLRLMASVNLNLFIVNNAPIFKINCNLEKLIAHSALRLTCNHSGYESLWREQVGDEWREPGKPPCTWPVLTTDDERWAVRAAIDAVVAQAYGLTRDQYAHILSTFSHKSYPNAPHLCLAAFDELIAIGLDAFTRKHDLYHDIPLNESLPKPVIDLPLPATTTEPQQGSFDLGALS